MKKSIGKRIDLSSKLPEFTLLIEDVVFMPVSLAQPSLRVTADNLSIDDINYILNVAIQNLKTVEHSLSLLKGASTSMPMSSWLEKTADLKNSPVEALQPLKTATVKKNS